METVIKYVNKVYVPNGSAPMIFTYDNKEEAIIQYEYNVHMLGWKVEMYEAVTEYRQKKPRV